MHMELIRLHHGEFSFLDGRRSNVISWEKNVKNRSQDSLGKLQTH